MYVRNPQRTDGFGAQFQNIIWCILFAEHNTMEFVYYTIKDMEHNYDKESDYIKKLIDYTNIRKFYKCEEVSPDMLFIDKENKFIYAEVESSIDRYHSGEPYEKLKMNFYDGKTSPYDIEYTNVALHIRRPNKVDPLSYRTNTPNSYYLEIMNYVRSTYTGSKPLRFHIYSQGEKDAFKELYGEDVFFFLDTNLCDTFSGLVFADILSISASSFSYSAALLSNGEIITPRFWHPPLKNWKVMEYMRIWYD